ncbi:unannotated protein [freshwater metagenome]|uniref:Unannotated protein n=1 Tax=freshwater metagenome TaxID=449393 RepID=A0A6J7EB36_9ZZZZ|nr:hypothetical protein [Actinomycetota bacterium]
MTSTEKIAALNGAMSALRENAETHGEPSLRDGVLYFGSTAIPKPDFPIVTSVQSEFGCAATILVAEGDGFVRTATTMIVDAERAIATPLEATSPALAPLRDGQSYQGPAEILGTQYDAYYEPIIASDGSVIGSFLVAFATA